MKGHYREACLKNKFIEKQSKAFINIFYTNYTFVLIKAYLVIFTSSLYLHHIVARDTKVDHLLRPT